MDIHDLCRIGNIHTKQLERITELLETLVKQGKEITKLADTVQHLKENVKKLEKQADRLSLQD